jgi:uncharacterized protein
MQCQQKKSRKPSNELAFVDFAVHKKQFEIFLRKQHTPATSMTPQPQEVSTFGTPKACRRSRSIRRQSLLRVIQGFVVGAILLAAGYATRADPLLTYPLRVANHPLRAELALTEEQRIQGLMFRKQLPENQGMVFAYPHEDQYAMWMKNTLIPLSVAFIDKNGVILNIADMEPQSERSHASEGKAKYALEMNRGWFAKRGIARGARVSGLDRLPPPK